MNQIQHVDDENWIIDDDRAVTEALSPGANPWRVLIVDDEPDMHAVTRMALDKVQFKGRAVKFLSAYSGAEGYEMLRREDDIAMVLLDVVMESDDAGLILVRRIREDLNNRMVRIVLRTGQPGQAPEDQVIIDYDINDYKAKTELTHTKLFSMLIASLRAYDMLLAIEYNRIGLTKILHGATNLYKLRTLQEFASGVLVQISSLLNIGTHGALCVLNDGRANTGSQPAVIAATAMYSPLVNNDLLPKDHEWFDLIVQVMREKKSVFKHPVDALYIDDLNGHEFVIVLTPPSPLEERQRNLLAVFVDRIAVAFDNFYMYDKLKKSQDGMVAALADLRTSQEATVFALADLAESRDADTGGHVRRICKLVDAVAARLHMTGKCTNEITSEFLSQVGLASMLHDIGKVSTPDAILLKPGKHTPEERTVMEQHAIIGEGVLMRAAKMVKGSSYLEMGAQISGGHHEHFDGNGYPRRLKEKEIHLGARITAVADVFDALLHRRPYKEPWSLDAVFAYLHERRGTQFDPDVVDALVTFIEIDKPEWIIGDSH